MNPFDWAGPQFLGFYSVFAGWLLALLWWVLRRGGSDAKPLQLTDPYEIACLRGGPDEMLRVATFGLIERRALRVIDREVFATDNEVGVTHPLERALVDAYRENRGGAFRSPKVRELTDESVDRLVAQGAWISSEQAWRETLIRGIILALLVGVALTKIEIALSRGRTNLAFLIALAVAASLVVCLYRKHRRTARGEEFLTHMASLLAGSFTESNQELVMMVAVLGAAGLSEIARANAIQIFPQWKRDWREQTGSGQVDTTNNNCSSSGDGGGGGCGGCSSS